MDIQNAIVRVKSVKTVYSSTGFVSSAISACFLISMNVSTIAQLRRDSFMSSSMKLRQSMIRNRVFTNCMKTNIHGDSIVFRSGW